MNLQEEIKQRSLEIQADGYPMSIGEIINLYRDNELDIHPEFQRFFRWTVEQKSRLIESILLGIPIPSIFVAQREDGVWDVIDGLQRLATIFQFVGILKDEEGDLVEPLVLEETKLLPSLKGKRWEEPRNSANSLTAAQKLYIKRAKLDFKIILKQSDEIAKYELFQRFNTGGSQLSNQEIRNCILISINRDFYSWLRDLSQSEDFRECIALTDRAIEEQYDLELVLRFVVLRQLPEAELRKVGDMGTFLTDRMVQLAEDDEFDYKEEATAFEETFAILSSSTRADSFRRYDKKAKQFSGGFLISAFEAVALGIGFHYSAIAKKNVKVPVEERIQQLWSNAEFTKWSGSGVRASQRIPRSVVVGRELLKP